MQVNRFVSSPKLTGTGMVVGGRVAQLGTVVIEVARGELDWHFNIKLMPLAVLWFTLMVITFRPNPDLIFTIWRCKVNYGVHFGNFSQSSRLASRHSGLTEDHCTEGSLLLHSLPLLRSQQKPLKRYSWE